MTSLLSKRWVQDILIYGIIGLIPALIIFGIVKGILNASNSYTDTAVHWHASIAYEACGESLDLKDAGKMDIIHGHNDDQIHVEGLVLKESDIALSNFFKAVNLSITRSQMEDYKNGDVCENTGKPGQVAFYVDGEKYEDPSQIIIQDKQDILVKFE